MRDRWMNPWRIVGSWAMIGLLIVLAGCGGTANQPTPTDTATAVPPTATATATVPATATPLPVTGNILITTPTSGATVASPVHVAGLARGIFEGQFSVEVRDNTGHVLGKIAAHGGSPGVSSDWQGWTVDVSYQLAVAAAPGVIAAYDNSTKDGSVIDLVTIPVTLKGVPPTATPAPVIKNIALTSPVAPATVSSPVYVAGQARNIYGGQFTVQVRDSANKVVLGQVTANGGTAGSGWQAWSVYVPYTLAVASSTGYVVAFDVSPVDLSVIEWEQVKVTLTGTPVPSGNISITSPAANATIGSPVHVTGQARNIFEGQFVVQVKDRAGKVIGQVAASGGSGPAWSTWAVDVPFIVTADSSVGSVVAFDLSAKDGSVIDLVSLPVTLKGDITLISPAMHASVHSPVHVTGQARNIFEGQFTVQVWDSAHNVVGTAHAFGGSSGVGSMWQPWSVDVPYTMTVASTPGYIVAFDNSAKDGSVIDMVSIPVMLLK